ncbi:hypothetical protein EIP86_006682 [Pleurotus ostreatoroseus]|nr:hypothetical protein EIP86_006682 [Pleurotus ostreatoroseus]
MYNGPDYRSMRPGQPSNAGGDRVRAVVIDSDKQVMESELYPTRQIGLTSSFQTIPNESDVGLCPVDQPLDVSGDSHSCGMKANLVADDTVQELSDNSPGHLREDLDPPSAHVRYEEPSFDGHRVWAVIVGINIYRENFGLKGACADALAVRDYLVSDLGVPIDNVRLLLSDHEAVQHPGIPHLGEPTRFNILNTLKTHFYNNQSIQKDDFILFYFAGFGSRYRFTHPQRADEDVIFDAVCPIDRKDICDRELWTFFEGLHDNKGDNITVILDCCFTRGEGRYPVQDVRYLPRAPEASLHFRSSLIDIDLDSSSCMILTACGPTELAEEVSFDNQWHGRFTHALLHSLRCKRFTSYDELQQAINALMPSTPLLEIPFQSAQFKGPGDTILFYFAGYGTSYGNSHDGSSVNALCPADRGSVGDSHVVPDITEQDLSAFWVLLKARSDKIVVIFDCSFGGDVGSPEAAASRCVRTAPPLEVGGSQRPRNRLFYQWSLDEDRDAAGEIEVESFSQLSRRSHIVMYSADCEGPKSTTSPETFGLKDAWSPVTFYACKPDQHARQYISSDKQHGFFTKALLQALKSSDSPSYAQLCGKIVGYIPRFGGSPVQHPYVVGSGSKRTHKAGWSF